MGTDRAVEVAQATAEAPCDQDATLDGTRMPRRRLLALMRRLAAVESRASRAQAGGVPLAGLDRVLGEIYALRWAVHELGRLYPLAAERARRDLEREQDRRRKRAGGEETTQQEEHGHGDEG